MCTSVWLGTSLRKICWWQVSTSKVVQHHCSLGEMQKHLKNTWVKHSHRSSHSISSSPKEMKVKVNHRISRAIFFLKSKILSSKFFYKNWESSTEIYTLPYVKQRARENLLYDAGSSNQVTALWGGVEWEVGRRFKREGTYVYLRLIHVDVCRNQHNVVKQLSSN